MSTGMELSRRRPSGADRGFTLMELLVTLAIAALLFAIGVPTFRDAGYRDVVGTVWFSLSGPAGQLPPSSWPSPASAASGRGLLSPNPEAWSLLRRRLPHRHRGGLLFRRLLLDPHPRPGPRGPGEPHGRRHLLRPHDGRRLPVPDHGLVEHERLDPGAARSGGRPPLGHRPPAGSPPRNA